MERYVHKVKYYECDRMGVTHHSNYVRFMEEARVDMMDKAGCGYEMMEAEGIVSPVTGISVDYKRPTTFQDEIEIEVQVIKMTNVKLKLGYVMKVGEVTVCTAESTHCFLENGKPVIIAERLPSLYEALK